METTIIEAVDTPEEQTPVAESSETVETVDSPEKESKETPTQEEPASDSAEPAPTEKEYEVDGEKITESQLRELRKKYERDSKWIQENERKAAELKRERQELAPLIALRPILEQRQDVLQQLFAPPPKRDYNREFQELYSQVPSQDDSVGVAQWNARYTMLNSEYQASILNEKNDTERTKKELESHNASVIGYGQDKYVKENKISQDEFVEMTRWIGENIQARGGKYRKEDYDIAYKNLFEDKYLSEIKLETAKKVVAPLTKAKQNGGDGVKKQEHQPSPQDAEDDAFVQVVRQKFKK